MSDERLQILKMLEEGKITAEEAANLLEAIGEPDAASKAAADVVLAPEKGSARWVRILVEESNGNRVNIKLPLFIIKAALRFGGHFNIGGFNTDELSPGALEELEQALLTGQAGLLVNVTDKNGDHVHIYLE